LEKETRFPDKATLNALCQVLGVSPESLTCPLEVTLGEIEFRKTARTTAADRAAVREELIDLLERYLEIEDILELNEGWQAPPLQVSAPHDSGDYAEGMALALREYWELGLEPIHDLTKLLEERGLKVLTPTAEVGISGVTCEVRRDGHPSVFAIVVNGGHTLERRRFILAHELAHRVLDLRGLSGKKGESLCNRFAGAFLVPRKTLEREMGTQKGIPTYREVILTKRFFRVSAAMLILRLKQAAIMDVSQRDWFFKTVGQNWRSIEPEPLEKPSAVRLEPSRFERLVYRALRYDFISPGKAADLLQLSLRQMELGIDGGPYSMD
jgi:Zn-dependent peptidase ImmA (M78 family)